MKEVDGLSQIASDHETFLLDMWGVMHDGSKPYDGALDAVKLLKGHGKRLIILSNSSKRKANSERMLEKLGFDVDDFDDIITSGDIAHSLLMGTASEMGCSEWEVLKKLIAEGKRKVFVFGSGVEDEEYCTSAGWTLAPIDEADIILARGTFTINDGNGVVEKNADEMKYWQVMEDVLYRGAQRKLPMLVSNPDKVRPDEGLPPMPGAIGDTYERFVWTTHCAPVGDMTEERAREYVKRIGKPFAECYEIALLNADKKTAIMVGDALETDMVGAANSGIDSIWVTDNGIHKDDVQSQGAENVFRNFNQNEFTYAYGRRIGATYLTSRFKW